MKFQGYMRFSLASDKIIQYSKDFANPNRRKRILNKPRYYKFTLVLFDYDGQKDITEILIKDKVDSELLGDVMVEQTYQVLQELDGSMQIHLDKSYYQVEVYYP